METFTLINFWKVVLVSRIPNFRGVKRHLKLSRKGYNPGIISEQTVSKPWQFNRVLGYLITLIRTQQGSIVLIYLTELFLITNEIILAVRKKICSLPSSDGCSSGIRWLFGVTIPTDFAGGRGGGGSFLEYILSCGIHIFFEIGKGHYYEITTIFTFFFSLGVIIIIIIIIIF